MDLIVKNRAGREVEEEVVTYILKYTNTNTNTNTNTSINTNTNTNVEKWTLL